MATAINTLTGLTRFSSLSGAYGRNADRLLKFNPPSQTIRFHAPQCRSGTCGRSVTLNVAAHTAARSSRSPQSPLRLCAGQRVMLGCDARRLEIQRASHELTTGDCERDYGASPRH